MDKGVHTSSLPGTPEEQRAQRLAIAFKRAGLDDIRTELIMYATDDVKSSGKELTDEEARDVFQLLRKIEEGTLDFRYSEEGKFKLVSTRKPPEPTADSKKKK